MKHPLILFDLDGTLVNTLRDIADSANAVLTDLGFPTHPTDAYRLMVGDGNRCLMQRPYLPMPNTSSTPP